MAHVAALGSSLPAVSATIATLSSVSALAEVTGATQDAQSPEGQGKHHVIPSDMPVRSASSCRRGQLRTEGVTAICITAQDLTAGRPGHHDHRLWRCRDQAQVAGEWDSSVSPGSARARMNFLCRSISSQRSISAKRCSDLEYFWASSSLPIQRDLSRCLSTLPASS
jgi:hypothetical protein